MDARKYFGIYQFCDLQLHKTLREFQILLNG